MDTDEKNISSSKGKFQDNKSGNVQVTDTDNNGALPFKGPGDNKTFDKNLQGITIGWIDKVLGVIHAKTNIAFITILCIFVLIIVNMVYFHTPLEMDSLIGLLGVIMGYLFGKGA